MELKLTAIEQIIVRQALERFQDVIKPNPELFGKDNISSLMLEVIADLIKRTK